MRKIISVILALVVAMMVSALPADAGRGGHGGHGGHGRHGGYSHYGGHYHGHSHHGGGHVGFGVYLGPGWWGPYPYYPSYPYYSNYPYYPAPLVIQQSPVDIYVPEEPQATEPLYWYYCENPRGFYPRVERCPQGWQKVPPPTNPGQ